MATRAGAAFHGCSLLGACLVDCRLRPITFADRDPTLGQATPGARNSGAGKQRLAQVPREPPDRAPESGVGGSARMGQ